ncbi:MAG: hypothetical protein ACTHOH_01310 [Lysobacteraceae bacterium]
MAIWNCASCGEDNDSVFGICWNCGLALDGEVDGADIVPVADGGLLVDDETPEARDLRCARCGAAMQPLGRLHFPDGARLVPLIEGALGERLIDHTSLDAYACTGTTCGKVEFFTITVAEVSRAG